MKVIYPEKEILDEINNKDFPKKRDAIAVSYFLLLHSPEEVDWEKVNKAIINRWSLSGLKYIKRKAWQWIEEIKNGAARFNNYSQ